MSDYFTYYAIPILLMVVVAFAGTGLYVHRRKKLGDQWEHRRVSRALKRLGLGRSFKVLDDVKLVDEGRSGWADHLVLAPFGALLVYDLCFPGEYSGKPEDQEWLLHIEKRGSWKVPNPLPAAGQCSGRVITLLKKQGIRVPVYQVVVAASSARYTATFVKSQEVIALRDLSHFLEREKFQQDLEYDLDKAEKILLEASPNPTSTEQS